MKQWDFIEIRFEKFHLWQNHTHCGQREELNYKFKIFEWIEIFDVFCKRNFNDQVQAKPFSNGKYKAEWNMHIKSTNTKWHPNSFINKYFMKSIS